MGGRVFRSSQDGGGDSVGLTGDPGLPRPRLRLSTIRQPSTARAAAVPGALRRTSHWKSTEVSAAISKQSEQGS
eukprot:749806-Hanusia_phi.AAC.13